jgi:hypothetical protein
MIIRQTLCWTSEMVTRKIKVKWANSRLFWSIFQPRCIVACQLTNPPSFEALADVDHTLLWSSVVTFDLLQHGGHAQAHIRLTPSPTEIS